MPVSRTCPEGTDHQRNGHLVAGQRPRLIKTDHRCLPQRLHRAELLDDGMVPGHALHAQGKGNLNHIRPGWVHEDEVMPLSCSCHGVVNASEARWKKSEAAKPKRCVDVYQVEIKIYINTAEIIKAFTPMAICRFTLPEPSQPQQGSSFDHHTADLRTL